MTSCVPPNREIVNPCLVQQEKVSCTVAHIDSFSHLTNHQTSDNPNILSCTTIDSTKIAFVFNPDSNCLESARYKTSTKSGYQDIATYPVIDGTTQPQLLSTIPKSKFFLLIQEGKWEVKDGDLKFYGMRGCGGANPKPDKMDLEMGMSGAASSQGIIHHANQERLQKKISRRVSIVADSADSANAANAKGKKGEVTKSTSSRSGDIELGVHNRKSTSADTSTNQEAKPFVPSSTSSGSVSKKKAKQTKTKPTKKAKNPKQTEKGIVNSLANCIIGIHRKSHKLTNCIAQAEENCYHTCLSRMASICCINNICTSKEQEENKEIIYGFGKLGVIVVACAGIIGSLVLHEIENGNLDLSKFHNHTGNQSSFLNNTLLNDKQWGDFLDDLKGLREEELKGSKTYSKGPMSVTYTPPPAYYDFLKSIEPINQHLDTVRNIGKSVKSGLEMLDPCNSYELPQQRSPSEQKTDEELLEKFKQQCRTQGHINYGDFVTDKSGGIISLPAAKKKRLEESVCQDVMGSEDKDALPPSLAYQTCLFNLCTAAEVVGAVVTIGGTIASFVPVLSGFSRAAEKAKDMIEDVAALTLKFSKMVLNAMRTLYKTQRVYLQEQKIFVENPKAVIKAYLQNLALLWMVGPDVIMNAAFIYILKSFALEGNQQLSTGLISRVQLAGFIGILSIIIPTMMNQWELPIGNLSVKLNKIGYCKALLLATGGSFISVSNLGIDPTIERFSASCNFILTVIWGSKLYVDVIKEKVAITISGCGDDNPFNTLSIGINNVISSIYSMIPCGLMGELIMNVIPEVPTMKIIDIQPNWCFEDAIQKTEEEIHSFFQTIIAIYLTTIVVSQVASVVRGGSYDLFLTAITYMWIIRSFCASDLVLSMPYLNFKYALPQPSAMEIFSVACCLASPILKPFLTPRDYINQLLTGDKPDMSENDLRQLLDEKEQQKAKEKEAQAKKEEKATKIQAVVRGNKARKDLKDVKETKTKDDTKKEHKTNPKPKQATKKNQK